MVKDIPLTFHDARYPGSIDEDHLCLTYTIGPPPGSQARFRDRLVGTPVVNLSAYEIKATFDWLDIYLPTKGRHQARNVHAKLMKLNEKHRGFTSCHVKGPRGENGYTGDAFVVRLQDPQPGAFYGLLRHVLLLYCP